ncbi:MAG: type II secretion system protein N [Legionella sp.]|uniref:type II secretion system protein N n=1 Tax=Legionella sp. TaxID=459 RepID=UPI0039E4641B
MKLDLHYLLSAKYAQWISWVLIILFSVLIIMECFSLRISPVPVASEANNIPIVAQSNSFDAVLKSSLFGMYVSNDLNENSVKKSMLNVTLVGILFADKIDDSQVIIRAANGEEKTYSIGDTIPGDAVIKKIMTGGVLVEHHGALESLSLPKNELTFEPIPEPLKEE